MSAAKKSRRKQAAIIALAIILVIGFSWLGYEVWDRWGELRPIPSTAGTIIFQTGGLSLAGAIAVAVFGSLLLAGSVAVGVFELPSSTKKCWYRTRSFVKTIKVFAGSLALMLVLLFGGAMMIYVNCYHNPCSAYIAIDKSARVISIEKHYLILRGEERLQILFSEIDHVTYHYQEGSAGPHGSSSSGRVEITKLDGMTIIVSSDGPKRQLDLARAIAVATGKELKRD